MLTLALLLSNAFSLSKQTDINTNNLPNVTDLVAAPFTERGL